MIGGYDEASIEAKGTKRNGSDVDKADLRKTDDGIFWMHLNTAHYWQVDMYEALVGEQKMEFTGIADAAINSGASYVYIPETKFKIVM